MLEVRYIKGTGVISGWCSDKTQFGNLDRGRDTEAIVVLNISVPSLGLEAYLYDGKMLIDNPDYVEPAPPRNLAAEFDTMKARLDKAEL